MLGASQPAEKTEVLVELADHICTITLNRPEKPNALTVAVLSAETLPQAVDSLARRITRNAPLAVRAVKTFAQHSLRRDLPRDQLDALDRRVRTSADLKEGLAARFERRSPVFRGE